MPDPYVGWDVFWLNAVIWLPAMAVYYSVEYFKNKRDRK